VVEPLNGVISTHTRYVPSADYNTALCWGLMVWADWFCSNTADHFTCLAQKHVSPSYWSGQWQQRRTALLQSSPTQIC